MNRPNIHVAGIGSWHGADSAGWLAVRRLANLWQRDAANGCRCQVAFHYLSSPQDLLDWFQPTDCVHLVDACLYAGPSDLISGIQPYKVSLQGEELKLSVFRAFAGETTSTFQANNGCAGTADPPTTGSTAADAACSDQESLRPKSTRAMQAPQATSLQVPLWQEPLVSLPSHRLELTTVLRLAAVLNRFPDELVLWPIPVMTTGDRLSEQPEVESSIAGVAQMLYETICRIGMS
ncbi:MAG: hypothetical protein NXI32_27870 [bacterium]|nr:hypothetical protein [bacterium]